MAVSVTEKPSAVSSHVSDTLLEPFLQKSFDPAEYLNAALPSLSIGSNPVPTRTAGASGNASLADLSSHTQTLLSQLNAQASRLTTVLTQLTDDIIRSGGRLAYEVDVLRGEAIGLSEALNDGLKDEISLFVAAKPAGAKEENVVVEQEKEESPENEAKDAEGISEQNSHEPHYITQLRMLTRVRQRLDSVIRIFGEAMQWTIPPSEVSITSSFISVSGPEPGADSQSREQKGREFAEQLRQEIADVVLSAENSTAGFDSAQARITALRDLAQVWKGTAEEKARIRFVDSLAKLAEDRLRELEKGDGLRLNASPRKRAASKSTGRGEKGRGFLNNLQKLHSSE